VTALVLFVAGVVAGWAAVKVLRDVLAHPVLARENYRGTALPTAAGLCLVVAALAVIAVHVAADPDGAGPRALVVAAVVGFGLLGLLDDVLGDAGDRGLRGHVKAALQGRITTGFLKLAGGAALGVVHAAGAGRRSVAGTIADGALIALAANLGNLFDRAPGRTIKWSVLAYVPLALVIGADPSGEALAPVMGAAVGLLPGDLRERYMLGDAGANVLGGALGVGAVLALDSASRTVLLVVLACLNLLSERVSFSRIIGAVPPLRAFDRLGRVALVLALAASIVALQPRAAGADAAPDERRLLVVSLPGLTWAEVQYTDMPNLRAFVEGAAIADMAPRSVRHSSRAGDAYLTIGAGARSLGVADLDGQQLAPDADYAGEPAGDVFERRTGVPAEGSAVALSWPALVRTNAGEEYDAVLGVLHDTLARGGVRTAVIGNADGSDTTTVSQERQAALAFADGSGRLDAGAVGEDLLVDDPSAPYGIRLDHDRVLDELHAVWDTDDRTAVLVEASDLARTVRYRSLVDTARYTQLRDAALRDADDLLGELLAEVDPAHDAVLVLAPYLSPTRIGLTAVAYREPGSARGYLKSASTQRAGIVTLVDVSPTILHTFGISRPTDMEGRFFEIERSSSSTDHRIDHLVTINAASRFRERLLTPTTIALVLALLAIVAATIVAIVDERSRRWRSIVAFAALADVAAIPVSYLARAFPLEDLGSAFYWTFLVAGSLAVAALATIVGRRTRRPLLPLTVVLALTALVLVVDVMTGSNLHMSAAFGYSPTSNSRLYGISNYSFGALSVSACLLASFVARRWRSGRGRFAAVGLMAFTLCVLGVPIWGSDVGGIIAFTPTILVFAALLYERRPSIRNILLTGFVTVAAVVVFGFIDLARPAAERAHLGRLFERIGNEGLEPLTSIVTRKAVANLRVSTSSFWVAAIPITIGLWLFLRWWRTRPLADVHAAVPTLHAALVAAAVAAFLGSAVNDSGAIVGGVASLVLATSTIYLAMTRDTT
jgi:hypothetical protein